MTRILYVDDEPDIREVAVMALELDPEYEVQAAGSGADALKIASEWQPHLILLDMMMPGMDGPTTLARLREQAATAAVPIVFVTARTMAKERDRLLGLGAAGVVPKPFDPMTLAGTVGQYLR